MAKRKCIICGEWIENNSQSIPYKGKWAHEKCFQIAVKAIKKDKDEKLADKTKSKKSKPKPKAELKEAVSEEEAKKFEKAFRENSFTFEDYLAQLENLNRMGNINDLIAMIPGLSSKMKGMRVDENQLKRNKAIIQSMT